MLFSLTGDSRTLIAQGLSAADVLYSDFDRSFNVFAGFASLGLLSTDDVDALEIAVASYAAGCALVSLKRTRDNKRMMWKTRSAIAGLNELASQMP